MRSSDAAFAKQLWAAIATVHDVQDITKLAIERKLLPEGWTGQFDPYIRTVTISPNSQTPLSTGAHEIGHALDALFLADVGNFGRLDGPITLYASQYAVQGRGVLTAWYQQVIGTQPTIEAAQQLRKVGFGSVEWSDLRYLLDPMEMWARSYEQFIALNTTDAELRGQFDQKRVMGTQIAGRKLEVYWTIEEFRILETEIKDVLETLGWL